jgi:penicillin-binding protein 1A
LDIISRSFGTLLSILFIGAGYLLLKPSLPEIDLVDENVLQIPFKVFTSDGVLIGEFGDQKRRTIEYRSTFHLILKMHF